MATQTVFMRKLGSRSFQRVLEFFIEGREMDYSQKDIQTNTKLNKNTVNAAIRDLSKEQYIFVNRSFGKMRLYKVNTQNSFVSWFIRLFDMALSEQRQKRIMSQREITANLEESYLPRGPIQFSAETLNRTEIPRFTEQASIAMPA